MLLSTHMRQRAAMCAYSNLLACSDLHALGDPSVSRGYIYCLLGRFKPTGKLSHHAMGMRMKRCMVPGILLMLALQAALLVAGDAGDILLPSQGHDEAAMAAKKRPWKCCDQALCTRSIPPICTCMDQVFKCPKTCKACGPSTADPSRRICQDQYIGDPGPICRPWECCDSPTCTKSNPPTCRCGDEVDKCSPTCKSCLPSRPRPSRRVCIDSYFGPFPPRCTPREAVAAGGN